MATEMVRVLNTHNGQTGTVPRAIYEHPAFNKYLVEVNPSMKEYVPELFKPQTPEIFAETQSKKAARKAAKNAPTEEIPEVEESQEPDSEKDENE